MLSKLRTTLLTLLVLTSLALSYVLWNGNWENQGEVSYTTISGLPVAEYPEYKTVTKPYQIILSRDGHMSLAAPSTARYQNWLDRLRSMHVYGLRPISQASFDKAKTMVTFQFGVDMSYRELMRWVPNLQPSILFKQGHLIYLYQATKTSPVMFAYNSGGALYAASTDLNVDTFTASVENAVAEYPWQNWNPQENSLVSVKGIEIPVYRYRVTTPSVIRLVHSFFVNPQTLTRVKENPHTVLWTDGSRAVWWEQDTGVLTFADPNIPQSSSPQNSEPTAVLQYVRDHGGSPQNAFLFLTDQSSGSESFTLRMYIGGYPLLSGFGDYLIQLQNGHVTQYQRPLNVYTDQLSQKTMKTITAAQLQKILHDLMPSTLTENLTVQLGYIPEPASADVVQLEPAYTIMESGMPLWTIDAVSGKVIKGMNSR
jgi:regulatory protein YycH of two-component signal transduction system YycFG